MNAIQKEVLVIAVPEVFDIKQRLKLRKRSFFQFMENIDTHI